MDKTQDKLNDLLSRLEIKISSIRNYIEENVNQDMKTTAEKLKSIFSSISQCFTWTTAVVSAVALAFGLNYAGIISLHKLVPWLNSNIAIVTSIGTGLVILEAMTSFCNSNSKKKKL